MKNNSLDKSFQSDVAEKDERYYAKAYDEWLEKNGNRYDPIYGTVREYMKIHDAAIRREAYINAYREIIKDDIGKRMPMK